MGIKMVIYLGLAAFFSKIQPSTTRSKLEHVLCCFGIQYTENTSAKNYGIRYACAELLDGTFKPKLSRKRYMYIHLVKDSTGSPNDIQI